jgi:hypothetical protein
MPAAIFTVIVDLVSFVANAIQCYMAWRQYERSKHAAARHSHQSKGE